MGLMGLAMLVPAAAFGLLWYETYWKHRDCIEEAWRSGANGCFLPEILTTYSGGGAFMIAPALFFLALAAVCVWTAVKVSPFAPAPK
jgi:hypothetical protein